ncbi:hypothetical protein K491DRAFT_692080 [Lophiostoma macrostomum CBS 122681]|uniref:Uncharacterized protein n=1 Tax=Lophiostoma macrostomum CBS 122681 TaxID=1314788 RepID=A0A6A6T9N6_9PLEO|nr:hypothetical protein K491DRAFT_692080 [Lophiostoma macrostomum CBS 122681]
MGFQQLLLVASLPLMALSKTPDSFQLYAYGQALGGLPLFNADGYAYVGDASLSNSSSAAPVTFSGGSDNTWFGAPNTTDLGNSTTPDWSNVTLFVPGSSSSDRRVGFLSSNSSDGDVVTSGFIFYGSTAMLLADDGDVESLWFGAPVGNTGVYEMYWNSTDSSHVPIALRSVAPTSANTERRRK